MKIIIERITKNLLIAIIFPAVSAMSFGETCEQQGWSAGSYPTGPDYVALNTSATYKHEAGFSHHHEKANFYNSEKWYLGYDEYNTEDIKVVAQFHMTFENPLSRGAAWVAMEDPVRNLIYCKNIIVQNLPTIQKKDFNSTSRTATVNFGVDQFSRFGRTGEPIQVTFKWQSDFYGTRGDAGSTIANSLSGEIFYRFSVGSNPDIYKITAYIYDGSYTASVYLGTVRVNGTPPCTGGTCPQPN